MNQFFIKCYRKLDYLHLMDWMPDKMYLSLKFRVMMGKKLNLKNPQTFNEKLQWLKLYDRKPIYTTMVDKYEAKKYVANIIGEEYIIPTLGVWDSPDEIDFDLLPNQFVLKCNHNSGRGMCICTDKSKLDIEAVKRGLQEGLNEDYYITNREWPYKDVPRKIIAEKYMVDESGYELKDYKLFCFDGFAKAMYIAMDRQSTTEEMKWNFYDMQFQKLPFWNAHPNSDSEIKRPDSFERMKKLAEKLSQGIPNVRVDFYDVDGQIYFGEMTFFHNSGLTQFHPEEWDEKFGEWIKLPDNAGGYLIASNGYILWIHEESADEQKDNSLKDYKFMCFGGRVYCSFVCSDRFSEDGLKVTFYDREWRKMPFTRHYPSSAENIEMPKQYYAMIDFAEKLSKDIPFVRVDFYEVDGHLYFGELTFYPGNGMEEFKPEDWDYKLGDWIKLPDCVGG
ncbi:MAG: hypothetical protein LUG49_07815 [Oscillospiraceae bacterium]|nr:hypothetical protein [Oscillospiraceae bacterium]